MLYQSIEHRVEVKLSHHLPNCATISHSIFFFFVLSSSIESEISEQVRRQIATGEVIIMKKKLFTYIARVTYAHTHTRITI